MKPYRDEQIVGALNKFGWADGLSYLLTRALSRATNGRALLVRYYVYAQPVADTPLTPARRGRDIVISEATEETILTTAFDRPFAVIQDRLNQGARCLLASRGDKLIGFQWFTTHHYLEDEVRCMFEVRPQDHCAWDFDIYVQPEERLRPVFSLLWDHCNSALRKAGIRTSISRISAYNTSSRRSHEKLGAKTIGWLTCLVAGHFQLTVMSARPWLHLSFSPQKVPVFPASRLAAQRAKRIRLGTH